MFLYVLYVHLWICRYTYIFLQPENTTVETNQKIISLLGENPNVLNATGPDLHE